MVYFHLQYRALAWDPQTGDSAGDLDAFSKYIVSKLCKNLEEKSKYYLKDGGFVAEVRILLFSSFLILVTMSICVQSCRCDLDDLAIYLLVSPFPFGLL